MKEVSKMLGENIKKYRKQKGYSQEVLAQEMNVVRQTISKWEKGYSVPDAVMLEKLAELFEVPVSDLLGNAETHAVPQSDLAQISAQLSILNEQMARELTKRRQRKHKLIVTLAVIFCIFSLIFIVSLIYLLAGLGLLPGSAPSKYGDVSNYSTHEVASELYTQKDIDSAFQSVEAYFQTEFECCTLTELYYAGDETSKIESGDDGGANLVLLSSFSAGYGSDLDGGSTTGIYSNWKWILEKNAEGKWEVVNYGYC